jgi:hypothetical protein
MKTIAEVRRAFWEAHPTMPRKKITYYGVKGKIYPTDTRCAFVDFVDYLARDGQISDSLAHRVTL